MGRGIARKRTLVRGPIAEVRAERSLVARRIQEVREWRKWSRQRLADALSVVRDESTTRLRVWRDETGARELSAADAALYAEALGVSVASLYREGKS